MNTVLDETKKSCTGQCHGCAVSEKLEHGRIAAERLVKRGRYAVEDGIEETAHNIKRHPFGSLAIAFAAGTALGLVAAAPRTVRK